MAAVSAAQSRSASEPAIPRDAVASRWLKRQAGFEICSENVQPICSRYNPNYRHNCSSVLFSCFVFPKEKREEGDGTLQQGPADTQDMGTDGQQPEEGNGKCRVTQGSPEAEQ